MDASGPKIDLSSGAQHDSKQALGHDIQQHEGKPVVLQSTEKISQTPEQPTLNPPTSLPSKDAASRPTIALGSAESPSKTVDLVANATATEVVNTFPGLGSALDTSAAKEDVAIQNSLPNLKADISGQINLATPAPVKVTLGAPKNISVPTQPNQAQQAASEVNQDASRQADQQIAEMNKASSSVELNAIDMKGQELLEANLEGKIGADTSLSPEMLDYANTMSKQVRQGVDKDLQPAMTDVGSGSKKTFTKKKLNVIQ